MTLKKCPCGKVPSELVLYIQAGTLWTHVAGNCCYKWQVTADLALEDGPEKNMKIAIKAWNAAPRKE